MRSIERVWTNPILIDETRTILAGHARLEAAKRLGRGEVPTLTIAGLSAAEKRAVVIADNRLPEQAVWDFDLLREHFKELIEIDFDVELTGFSTGEIDLVLDGKPAPAATDPADDLTGLGRRPGGKSTRRCLGTGAAPADLRRRLARASPTERCCTATLRK